MNGELAAVPARTKTLHTRVLEECEPSDWARHRFGLPESRWEALRGACVWVTGAGTGFGRSLAVALAAAGARVVLSGRRATKLVESLEEMRRFGIDPRGCLTLPVDVRDPAELEAAAQQIARELGPLRALVNNAALPQPANGATPLLSMSPSNWSAIFATNLFGPWLASRLALRVMLPRGMGRILLISSEAGWAATPGFGAYNATKAALNSLGASLGAEIAAAHPGADIQVNVLVPGEARSEMNRGSSESPYRVVSMALALLSHGPGGPTGRFFHRDGRHLGFAQVAPWERDLLDDTTLAELAHPAGSLRGGLASLRARFGRARA